MNFHKKYALPLPNSQLLDALSKKAELLITGQLSLVCNYYYWETFWLHEKLVKTLPIAEFAFKAFEFLNKILKIELISNLLWISA